jgi:hypothetical protein
MAAFNLAVMSVVLAVTSGAHTPSGGVADRGWRAPERARSGAAVGVYITLRESLRGCLIPGLHP